MRCACLLPVAALQPCCCAVASSPPSCAGPQVHNNPNLTQSVINTLDADVRNDISSRIEKAHKIMQRWAGAGAGAQVGAEAVVSLLHRVAASCMGWRPGHKLHAVPASQPAMQMIVLAALLQ